MVATAGEDVFQQESLELIQSLPGEAFVHPRGGPGPQPDQCGGSQGHGLGGSSSALSLTRCPKMKRRPPRFRGRVLEDDFYAGSVVSQDGRLSLLALELDPQESAVEVAARVLEAIDEDGVYATGTPVLNSLLAKSMKEDLIRLIPLVVLLIALVLYLYFHNLWESSCPS